MQEHPDGKGKIDAHENERDHLLSVRWPSTLYPARRRRSGPRRSQASFGQPELDERYSLMPPKEVVGPSFFPSHHDLGLTLPDDDTSALFLTYAVLLLAKGQEVTRADVHNAWVAWMIGKGETHESMVPFAELPPQTQAEDSPFMVAIRTVAQKREPGRRLPD
jgi:hypothetical protein